MLEPHVFSGNQEEFACPGGQFLAAMLADVIKRIRHWGVEREDLQYYREDITREMRFNFEPKRTRSLSFWISATTVQSTQVDLELYSYGATEKKELGLRLIFNEVRIGHMFNKPVTG